MKFKDKTQRFTPLDRQSAVPLYHQLFIDLRRRLLNGEWSPGDSFPKDIEIEQDYEVSRITVRQAVSMLVERNFVVRYRGKGSFVGNLPLEGAKVNHRTVAAEITESGKTPTNRNLSVERHAASDVTADQLNIDVGAQICILQRLHLADRKPFCIEWVMLASDRYPDVFDRVCLDEETLIDAYLRLDIDVVKCDQTVQAVLPSKERRLLLDIPEEAPALLVERVGFSLANHPLDVRRLYYRGDQHALRQGIIWGSADQRIV